VPKEQLREAIARLLLDPDLRARMGRAARDYAATLLFSDAAAALGGIIQHCIVGSSPGLR